MTSELRIHPATEEERLEAYRNVFDVWSDGHSLESHLERRLSSAQHNRAHWFVGCQNGKVVASLACYPMRFQINGQTEQGISIGSLHTLEECRGRGFAPQLIQWVEQHQRERGVTISLLYSDISPDYYARMGYQVCPSWEAWIDPQLFTDDTTTPVGSLIPISPSEESSTLSRIYDAYHSQFEISIGRNEKYWNFLLQKAAGNEYFYLNDAEGNRLGYVLLGDENRTLTLRDWAYVDQSSNQMEILLNSLIIEGKKRNSKRVGGWMPAHSSHRKIMPLKERQQEITMLKCLTGDNKLKTSLIAATEHFREIDHV